MAKLKDLLRNPAYRKQVLALNQYEDTQPTDPKPEEEEGEEVYPAPQEAPGNTMVKPEEVRKRRQISAVLRGLRSDGGSGRAE